MIEGMKKFFHKISNFVNDHWRVPFFLYFVFALYTFLVDVGGSVSFLSVEDRQPYTEYEIHYELWSAIRVFFPMIIFLVWKRIFHPNN